MIIFISNVLTLVKEIFSQKNKKWKYSFYLATKFVVQAVYKLMQINMD